MDDRGIRLLRLVGLGDIEQMHHRLTLAVHPRPREGEIRPGALLQAQNVLVEPDRLVELPGPDVEMIEHAYAHAHAVHSLFCEVGWRPILAQNPPASPNEAVALQCAGFMVPLPAKNCRPGCPIRPTKLPRSPNKAPKQGLQTR